MRALVAVLRWLAGFLEQHTPQSMARLVALLLAVGGIAFAFRHPTDTATCSVLVIGGAVGLLLRKSASVTATTPAAAPAATPGGDA